MKYSKSLPWIIPEHCEGCSECINACPTKCLYMKETLNQGIFIPWIEDPDECIGCGKCQDACIWLAISLTIHVDEAHERFINFVV